MTEGALILGVRVAQLTMAQAVARVRRHLAERRPALVATANAEMLMRAQDDPEWLSLLQGAELVVADGAGTVWAAHRLGYEMPERVAGFDLVQRLMAEATGARFYLLGSKPGVADRAAAKAREQYPGVNIVGAHDGYFDAAGERGIIAEMRERRAEVIVCGLGAPKQERWLRGHLAECGAVVGIGVGGTLDVMAGTVRRAPHWVQRLKLEWLWRGLSDPSRLGRLAVLPRFVLKVIVDSRQRGAHSLQ